MDATEAGAAQAPAKPDVFAAYMRGVVVTVAGLGTATVYPLSLRQLMEHAKDVAVLISTLEVAARGGGDHKQVGMRIFGAYGAQTISRLSAIMRGCVKWSDPALDAIELVDLQHHDWLAIFNAWLETSFGREDQLRPWKQAMDKLTESTGSAAATSATPSSGSSPAVTT